MSDLEKVLILVSLFLLFVPSSYALMRSNDKYESYILFFTVLLSTFGDRFGFSIDYDFEYRGTISGYSVQLCDFLYFSLFLRSISRRITAEGKVFLFLYIIYIFSTIYSTLISKYVTHDYWKYGVFESLKFFGILFYFSNSISTERARVLFFALATAAAIHGAYFLAERYLLGVHRVSGVFNHPNLVSSVVLLLFAPLLYVTLSENVLKQKHRVLVFLAALFISTGAILTVSRAMIIVFLFGAIFIVFVAMLKNYKASRVYLIVLMIIAVAGGVKGYDTFSGAFAMKGLHGGGRQEMNALALTMFTDSATGVGINNFSLAANDYGIESMQAAYTGHGLPPVHNVYLLTLAESGVPGLLFYIAFLFFPPIVFVRAITGVRKTDFVSALAKGMSIGIGLLFLQALLEDSPRREFVMYLLYPYLAMLAAYPEYQRSRRRAGQASRTRSGV